MNSAVKTEKFIKNRLNSNIIKGTLILSAASILSRIIGFIYRIYLADILGEKLLGTYQLIFPIYVLCFTIYGAGMQSAISQVTATFSGRPDTSVDDKTSKHFKRKNNLTSNNILLTGIIISLTLALSLSAIINLNSNWIACHILMVPDCDIYLKLLTYLFPFCSISACICGFQYGLENAKPPAIAGIIEQFTRILFVFIVQGFFSDKEICCQIAVYGLTVGEFFGFIYNIYSLKNKTLKNKTLTKRKNKVSFSESFKVLFPVFISLTSIKLTISLLHSVESIFIPSALVKYGYTMNEALSVYGIYSGMAMPFILFPATITMAISTMLLPAVSKAHSSGNKKQIKKLIRRTSYFCLVTGMSATVFFLLFGNTCANLFFHNELAGRYLTILSFLCPFLYLNMTYSSILNGLGKPHMTFVITVICTLIKILSLIFFVPDYGMIAYIFASLVSETLLCVMLKHYCNQG
ncbi:oligosaccharide flippase family protein [Butyribacter sp.]|uniref:oligosaccharide flippase family protein n=1 Tax=Butyribacter sp. TaxID=2822465 RepID=UPI002A9AD168|nr:polysaccharide biosynthesis protein [Butyribacter sp.]